MKQNIIDALKEIYENTQLAIIICSPDGKLIWVNEKSIMGNMSQSEFAKFFQNSDDLFFVYHFNFRGENLTAQVIRIEINGVHEGYLGRITSAAEIVKLTLNLDMVNRVLAQYATIRESVAGIVGICEYLQQKLDNRGMYEDIKHVNSSINYCYNILASLCNYQECTKYAFDVRREAVINISELVSHTINHISSLLCNQSVRFKLRCDKNIYVKTDPDRFINAFLNIIINGVQYNISEKKMINITVQKSDGGVIISVKDNGSGISERSMKKIDSYKLHYLPYPQVSEDGSDVLDFGSGMRVVTLFCDTFGCKLIVNTKHDEGTTVSIKMPVSDNISQNNDNCIISDYINNRFSNLYVILSKISPINF